MAFYSPDASMDQRLTALRERLAGEGGGALADGLSITWLRYDVSLPAQGQESQAANGWRAVAGVGSASPARGASWQGSRLRDPGDLVQLAYLIASERWLQQGMLEEESELRRALLAMIRLGSHDATSYVVDRLSGTTSGPALAPASREAWLAQRLLVNGWLASLGWPELEGCQALHKTWQDGPYGRERDCLGTAPQPANRFSSDGFARLFEGVMAGTLISPPACQRMRSLLAGLEHEGMAEVVDPPAGLAPLLPLAGPGWRRFWGRGSGGQHGRGVALYGEGEGEGLAPTLLVILAEPTTVDCSDGLLGSIVAELLGGSALSG